MALAVALLVFGMALVAGLVRLLPLVIAHGAASGIALPLARGVLGMALEVALFVAPPVASAIAAAKLLERGEATALFAVGASPLSVLKSAWPVALVSTILAAGASLSWGIEAEAPGRLAQALVNEARTECAGRSQIPDAVPAVDIAPLGVSWVCMPGEPPRIVGKAPGMAGAFAATSLALSGDLRTAELANVQIVVAGRDGGEIRVRADDASLRGFAPLGRGSNLDAPSRTALLSGTAISMAVLAGWIVLRWNVRARTSALLVGASGPAAALGLFASFERGATPRLAYAAVALAGPLAMLLALGTIGIARRASRSAPG